MGSALTSANKLELSETCRRKRISQGALRHYPRTLRQQDLPRATLYNILRHVCWPCARGGKHCASARPPIGRQVTLAHDAPSGRRAGPSRSDMQKRTLRCVEARWEHLEACVCQIRKTVVELLRRRSSLEWVWQYLRERSGGGNSGRRGAFQSPERRGARLSEMGAQGHDWGGHWCRRCRTPAKPVLGVPSMSMAPIAGRQFEPNQAGQIRRPAR